MTNYGSMHYNENSKREKISQGESMLLAFSIENWRSFKEKTEFSLWAGKERQHGTRLFSIGKQQNKVLPLALIYGGNASGKSNFFKALHFVKRLVLTGTPPGAPLFVEPFRLEQDMNCEVSRFSISFLAHEKQYDYRFAISRTHIVEEALAVESEGRCKWLFQRRGMTYQLGDSWRRDAFLQYICQGTRQNQLLLTNAIEQNAAFAKPVFSWFRHQLVLIAPDTQYDFMDSFVQKMPLLDEMNAMLAALDTGICRLAFRPLPSGSLVVPEELKQRIVAEIEENGAVRVFDAQHKQHLYFTRQNGTLAAYKLVSYHRCADGREVEFDLNEESDGTKRMIDLLPAFLAMTHTQPGRVYVIDELDRSLHTQLVRYLIVRHLSLCQAGHRNQLILTTHDTLLMDQKILRRDEIWVCARDAAGVSQLQSLQKYKGVRYDKDLQKSYLQGSFGGVPLLEEK